MSYPLYPKIKTVEEEKEIKFFSSLRIEKDGKWYLFDMESTYTLPTVDREDYRMSALHHHMMSGYLWMCIDERVDPDICNEEGVKVYRLDDDQTPEKERFLRDNFKSASDIDFTTPHANQQQK